MTHEKYTSADSNGGADIAEPSGSCALIRVLAFAAILFIPLRILGEGYLPSDDTLRHAAKAVSGREWNEVLVLRPGVTMDTHPAWHAILGSVHRATGWSAHSIVLFSVVAVFALFSSGPLVLMRRPEAWLLGLLIVAITEPKLGRLMLGRPFILTASAIVIVCILWSRLDEESPPWTVLASLTILTALTTWIHGSWYLLSLPIGCFFLARQWRAAKRLSICAALGVALGALLTGQPLTYLTQAVVHGYLALGTVEPASTIALEFRPFAGAPLVMGVVLALLAWRAVHGRPIAELLRDPVFVLMTVGWALGFVAVRFYSDWAIPALLVFIAREAQMMIDSSPWARGAPRLGLTIAVAVVLILSMSADINSRWTGNAGEEFLALDNPAHSPFLPEPGGILYSPDMTIFYRTFFRNPDAPWRYILGFEPGLMPPEDLEVFRNILQTHGTTESYLPWVRKMKPADRLILQWNSSGPPPVPGLEWSQPAYWIWSGRLPRTPSPHQ